MGLQVTIELKNIEEAYSVNADIITYQECETPIIMMSLAF